MSAQTCADCGKEDGMIAYKLLNPDLTTYYGCQWVVGEKKTSSGEGELCGPGWLHAYEHAEIAHFLNPIHADFKNPVMYYVEVGGKKKRNGQLKSGWTEMTLLKPCEMAIPTLEQRVRFALYCATAIHNNPPYRQWAIRWLTSEDRSAAEAWAAAAAWAAWAAEAEAAWAAEAAAAEAWAAAAAAEAEAAEAARAAARATVAARAAKKDGLSIRDAARWAMGDGILPPHLQGME